MSGSGHHPILDRLAESPAELSPVNRRLLERCRDMMLGCLSGSLKAMLDKLVDELFELADKATFRDVQTLYLDAMAIVRDKRGLIEAGFQRHLQQNFDRSVRGLPLKNTAQPDDPDALRLVEPDDLEETLAVQDMASKIRECCGKEVAAAEQRMAILVQDADFQRRHNPLSPEVLADAFMAACKETHAGIKVLLIFVMMWDKHMHGGILIAYQEMNAYLLEKGVLPRASAAVARARGADRGQAGARPAPGDPPPLGEVGADVYAALQHFFGMAALPVGRSAAVTAGGGVLASGMPAASGGAAPVEGTIGAGTYVPNLVLVNQLTELQQSAPGVTPAAPDAVGATAVPGAALGVLREIKAGPLGASASQLENMTIEIVAMLFDFIFDDKAVPDAIKALIGRLQIPVLKAALLDQAFFSKKQHPARRLLNAIAEAAVGWTEAIDHASPMYREVEAIVQKVLDTFEDDVAVFSEALAQFEVFLAESERAAEQLAQAGAALLAQREREQQSREEARLVAEDAVRDRAAREDLPEVVRDFLAQRWTQVLARAFLAGGTEGSEWSVAIAVMDDLIWSVEPKLTDTDRKALVQRLPSMLKRLREGLDAAGVVPAVCEQFMSELVLCHAAAVKAGFQAAQTPPEPNGEVVSAPTPPASAVVLPFPKQTASTPENLTLEIIRQPNEGVLEVEEITIAPMRWLNEEPSEENAPAAEDKPEDLVPRGDTVEDLRPGMWVEFRHHGGEVLQAKLKWISPLKTAYLFTDRQGRQAATMPLAKLEAAFRIGSARIIEEVPLVDRAVDHMLESLKRNAA